MNCAMGCKVRGAHLSECDTDKCVGCLPRRAEFGTLCAWDFTRLNGDLVDTPQLIAHLYDLGQPNAGHKPGDGRSGNDPAHRNPLPREWLDANELESILAELIESILDNHPANLTGPPGTRWATGGLAGGPSTGERWHVDPRPIGTNQPHAGITWILPLLPWAATQYWIKETRETIGAQISTLKARYPIAERGRHVAHIPCPRCDHIALWYTPPTPERPTMQVHCTNPDCGRTFPEPEVDRMLSLITLAATKGLIA